jgi:flagellar biosynthesis activator protein FlaF
MYKFSYDEIAGDGGSSARAAERQALLHSLNLLRNAELTGAAPRAKFEALTFVNNVWSFLLEDLAKPDNALPERLRASLISIGFWMLRESDAIGDGRSSNIRGLIEVTEMIAEGLQ